MISGRTPSPIPPGQYWVVSTARPGSMTPMDEPAPNATTDGNARRARRLLLLLMVVFILLPWLVLLLRH
jgi:hypothetical protein